jgi:6-phospho-3-hexuloisomerase
MAEGLQELVRSRELVLKEVCAALRAVDPMQIDALVDTIRGADKVFVTGVGRVRLSMMAWVKRLNHLGIRAYCVGDLNEPAISNQDLLLVGSGSGESVVPLAIARVASSLGAKIVHIGSNPSSSLAPIADFMLRIPVRTRLELEDELPSEQIMTSLFEQVLFILGDVVCLIIAKREELDLAGLWLHHANLE